MGRSIALLGAAALALSSLVGCGGDRPGDLQRISATVSGLVGTGLVLEVNGTREVSVSANGTVTLAFAPSGAHYSVAVKTQPGNPSQVCAVSSKEGTVGSVDVTEIAVSCVTTFALGGSVNGLSGTGLVLHSSLGDDLPISPGAGSFVFSTRGSAGTEYMVTVARLPTAPQQVCTVNGEKGTLVDADALGVRVTCSTKAFTVGGTVTNLVNGSALLLQNNSTGDREVTGGDGYFAFEVADEADYRVTVKAQPTRPWQTCMVQNGSGTVRGAPVDSVRISCVENSRVVRGAISGLQGSGLELRLLLDGDREDVCSSANGCIGAQGAFVFAGKGMAGSPYAVTVARQPSLPAQNCTIANGAGTIGAGDVTDVVVVCSKNLFYNSDFSLGFPTNEMVTWRGGWAFSSNSGDPTVVGPTLDEEGWRLEGGDGRHNGTAGICQTGHAPEPTDWIEAAASLSEVTPGKRYVASAYSGAHRSKVDLYIVWIKADGTDSAYSQYSYDDYEIGDATTTGRANSNNWEVGPGGSLIDARDGATLDRYKRIVQVGTAPPDASYARPVFRKWNTKPGQDGSCMFLCRAQLEEVAPGVAQPGAWIPTE